MDNQTHDIGPWYKQPWLWLVLAPLIAVVIYASTFMYLAVSTSDGIVRDDYYKVARGTNVDTTRTQRAAELGIRGDILIDSLTGDIRLTLKAKEVLSDRLLLDLVHPSHQKYDQSITLRSVNADSGIYLGSLISELQGKRYLLLSDTDETWRIRREIDAPYDQSSFDLSGDQ